MHILIINTGSSSFKLSLYNLETPFPSQPVAPQWIGSFEWDEQPWTGSLTSQNKRRTIPVKSSEEGFRHLLDEAAEYGPVDVIGHRIVHGGDLFIQPTRITPPVLQKLRELIPLAPLHNPSNIRGIEMAIEQFPFAEQVAVFDTAFHHTLPEEARVYPGPYRWNEMGIKRYGFHGISHQYCYERMKNFFPAAKYGKVISCHLGNGASLAAISDGKSIDTTMGFTPTEGLMMGTRCGSIDPSIVLYLLGHEKETVESVQTVLNKESGLKGISGKTEDMRQILALKAAGESRAVLAWKMYLHSLQRNIGAMIGVLSGVESLIFAGGIGENSAEVRAEICAAFSFLGIKVDEEKNQHGLDDREISTQDSHVAVFCIKTREDWMIVRECFHLATKAG